MSSASQQWLTLHRVRFASEISARERKFDAPARADCWRFVPSMHLDPKGLPSWVSDTWCGLGIYDDREDAEAVVAAPQAHFPWISEAIEQWHALLTPFVHRGAVNWRGSVQEGCAIRPSPEKSTGPLAVITSAGYNSRGPDQVPRMVRFLRGVQDVLEFYGEINGNVRRDAFVGGFDLRDGFTVSLWRDEKAMTQAAYSQGEHRRQLDTHRDGSLFDRSSFTRATIISSNGSWDGDPLAAVG